MSKPSVLVLGEDTRSFLSVVRSVGQLGYTVDVICYDNTSPTLRSCYINQSWNINYQANTEQEWLEQVHKIICQHGYDLVLPCDERAIFPLNAIRDSFPENTKLGVPNNEVMEHLFDKNKTKLLAEKSNIPTAKGILTTIQKNGFQELATRVGLPFVIKPTESFSENNLAKRNKVEIISSEADFASYVTNVDAHDTFLIETYFSGVGEGVSIFAVNGAIQYAFAHTRVHEPRAGGGSSYRVACALDPELLNACEKLCHATHYDGVGMFEFKRNPDTQQWILIEVNARFWGSLPLAIYAGIDFPAHYAKHLLNKFEPQDEINTDYRVGARARSLTNDLYDARIEMAHIKQHQSRLKAGLFFVGRIAEFAKLLGDERIDTFDKVDKGPFKAEVNSLIGIVKEKLTKKFTSKRRDTARASLRKALNKAVNHDGRVVFVCYGNIMRSPFAELYFKRKADSMGITVDVASFGFHQKQERCSPTACVETAREFGISLDEHRSRWLKQNEIKPNDIVFIFDELNEDRARRSYSIQNLYQLADFLPVDLANYNEIADPWGTSAEKVTLCYQLISAAIDNIFDLYDFKNKEEH